MVSSRASRDPALSELRARGHEVSRFDSLTLCFWLGIVELRISAARLMAKSHVIPAGGDSSAGTRPYGWRISGAPATIFAAAAASSLLAPCERASIAASTAAAICVTFPRFCGSSQLRV